MADKKCEGCGEEQATFVLTIKEEMPYDEDTKNIKEYYCADCMGHLIIEVTDGIVSIFPMEAL